MSDVNGILQVERLHEGRQVGGVGRHVVAVPGLAGTAVAAPVVRDATVAARGEEEHLVFEGVRAERPAVAEDDGLALAPVLVVDLGAVLRRDVSHAGFSWRSVGREGYGRKARRNCDARAADDELAARQVRLVRVEGVHPAATNAALRDGYLIGPRSAARRRNAPGVAPTWARKGGGEGLW